MRLLRFALRPVAMLPDVTLPHLLGDSRVCHRRSFRRNRWAIRPHVRDASALVKLLCQLHGGIGGEVQVRTRQLLQAGSREGWRGRLLALLGGEGCHYKGSRFQRTDDRVCLIRCLEGGRGSLPARQLGGEHAFFRAERPRD